MKFDVSSKSFLETLSTIGAIVNPKISELVKKQVLLEVHADNVVCTVFNQSSVLKGKLNVLVAEQGSACVDLFYLLALLNKLNGTMSLEILDNKVLQIKCGRSKYKTALYPEDEFREHINLTSKWTDAAVKIEIEPLKAALSCVYSSSSKDNENLSGAYIYHEGSIDMVTCSNTELGAMVAKENLIAFPEGVLPKFLVDFISKIENVRFLDLQVNKEGFFKGIVGPYTFIYRSMNYDYPWAEIYGIIKGSEAYGSMFRFSNEDMLEVLNRIGVITDSVTHAIHFQVANDKIKIETYGAGSSGEEIVDLLEPIGYEYDIVLDSAYLYNVLKDFVGPVTWSFFDEDNPQFVTDGYLTKFFMGSSE
jgi:DNA polymerase III sliding clamp (beta) subunit (PCNA family)